MFHNQDMPAELSSRARLGAIIRLRRKELGWTLERFSEETGLSPAYVSNIERAYVQDGRRTVTPSDEALSSIARALGLNVSVLHGALDRSEGLAEIERIPIADGFIAIGYNGNIPAPVWESIQEFVRFQQSRYRGWTPNARAEPEAAEIAAAADRPDIDPSEQ